MVISTVSEAPELPIEGAQAIETVIIGGGQAGLSVGYHLAKQGRPFVILDAEKRIGDAWRNRWDSLRLFTPARINGLPGARFPARGDKFITKDEMADYLEAYAARFRLPVRSGVPVSRLWLQGDRFVVSAGDLQLVADNVVVAMGRNQKPWIPPFAEELDPQIRQFHSLEYRNPSQLRDGDVLVVGAGNSGAEIALEVARTHSTWMAGKESGHVPFRIESFVGRHVLVRIVRFVGHHVLSVRTPIGRKVRPKLLTLTPPLVRARPKELVAAGVHGIPRVVGARNGKPLLDDGRVMDVANIIWCTGFRPGFSWIDLPIFGDRQEPSHNRGVVDEIPGLYFVGLHFLTSLTSETVTGAVRDSKRIAAHITARASAPHPARSVQAVTA